jgi:hypothetical protein
MQLELHLDAAKNFDAKAEELVSKLIPDPYARQRRENTFNPGVVIHELPESAEVTRSGYVSPYGGREIAKYFWDGSQNIGLFEEGYKDLVRLAERIQKNKTFRDRVSLKLLIELIFKWVKAKHQRTTDETMTAEVLAECEKELKELELWLPIAFLNIESEMTIGRVTLRTVTKEMLEEWFELVRPFAINNTEAQIEARFDKWREDMQGYAAATIKVFAEPIRAAEIAVAEAERAVALLRVFSPASYAPEQLSYTVLRGKEVMEGFNQLTVEDGHIIEHSEQSFNHSTPVWRLANEGIIELYQLGLYRLSDLLNRDKLTQYQEALLDSVLLYSKAALAKDPVEKLIAIVVALESFLLKDSNEPIQQNLAERIAFLFDESSSERREKKKQVLSAYSLRSAFIHHGHNIGTDEMDTLQKFLGTAWLSVIALIGNSDTYKTKEELFDKIEGLKMGGKREG